MTHTEREVSVSAKSICPCSTRGIKHMNHIWVSRYVCCEIVDDGAIRCALNPTALLTDLGHRLVAFCSCFPVGSIPRNCLCRCFFSCSRLRSRAPAVLLIDTRIVSPSPPIFLRPDIDCSDHSFRPEVVIPFINDFWKTKNTISIGIIVTTDMASSISQSMEY